MPNTIKKPVSIHNRWKALQQEDEDINYDLTDTKGPTENIKEEFEHAGWKVVQKKSQSNKSESNRKGGKESSKSENNRSGTTQIYGKFGKSSLHSLTAEEEESEEPILGAVEHWKAPSGDWTCIKTVVDSGAVDSVAPLTMAPAAEVKSSPGCQRGQHYLSASGDRLANMGQQTLRVATDDGEERQVTFQVAEVSRPLTSVAKICDQGNRVVFGSQGGYIMSLKTGKVTPFQRESGVYALNLWMKGDSPAGFSRPGNQA